MYKFLPTKKTALTVLGKLLTSEDLQLLRKKIQVAVCVGMPGSGKTTIAELLVASYGYWRFSSDQIRVEEFFPDQNHRLATRHEQVMKAREVVYEELARRTVDAVKRGQRIVIDGTNLDDKRDILMKALLPVMPPERIALIVLKTPEKIMKQRFIKEGKKSEEKWLSVYRYWKQYFEKGKASYPSRGVYPGIHLCQIQRYDLETFAWILDIGVIVWDVDSTLYKEVPKLHQLIEKAFLYSAQKKLGGSMQESKKEFYKLYKQLGSKTKVLDHLGYNGRKEVAKIARKVKFQEYLKKDKRLQYLFRELSQFHHVVLTNDNLANTKKKLSALGLPLRYFSEIFATHALPYLKPDPRVFQHVIKQTSFSPHQHLYVGDREETDILPAKAAGMRTAMVWSKSNVADVSFAKVYNTGRLFGVEV